MHLASGAGNANLSKMFVVANKKLNFDKWAGNTEFRIKLFQEIF